MTNVGLGVGELPADLFQYLCDVNWDSAFDAPNDIFQCSSEILSPDLLFESSFDGNPIIDHMLSSVNNVEKTTFVDLNEHVYCKPPTPSDFVDITTSESSHSTDGIFDDLPWPETSDGNSMTGSSSDQSAHISISEDNSSSSPDLLETALNMEGIDLSSFDNPVTPGSSHSTEDVASGVVVREFPSSGPLILTDEELAMCEKEGLRLPESFPLTRGEQSQLRKIKRKIRNKQSAQNSRRNKRVYVTALEERVKKTTEQNLTLRAKLDQERIEKERMANQNKSLIDALRKLQQSVSRGGRRQVQNGTCLAVLLLSLTLLVAPSYNPFKKQSTTSDQTLRLHQQAQIKFAGQTRTILQSGGVLEGGNNVDARDGGTVADLQATMESAYFESNGSDHQQLNYSQQGQVRILSRPPMVPSVEGRKMMAAVASEHYAAVNNKLAAVVKNDGGKVVPHSLKRPHAATNGHRQIPGMKVEVFPTAASEDFVVEPPVKRKAITAKEL